MDPKDGMNGSKNYIIIVRLYVFLEIQSQKYL
jgi:hypothetical protein